MGLHVRASVCPSSRKSLASIVVITKKNIPFDLIFYIEVKMEVIHQFETERKTSMLQTDFPYNPTVADFSMLGHVTQKLGPSSKLF